MDALQENKCEWLPMNICRCCLLEGCYKDISTEYFWLGEKEIYEKILKETFDITISYQEGSGPSSGSRLICDNCITKLRDAASFKQQVTESERKFVEQMLHKRSVKVDNDDLKLETIKQESEEPHERLSEGCSSPNAGYEGLDNDTEIFDDGEQLLSEIKLEATKEVADVEFKRRTRPKVKRKATSRCKARVKKSKSAEVVDEVDVTSEKTLKGASTTRYVDTGVAINDGKLKKAKRQMELNKKRIKENILKLVQNSNVCLFRRNRTKYKCFYCDETFSTMLDLRGHATTKHTEKEIAWKIKVLKLKNLQKIDISDTTCGICSRPCKDIENLQTHLCDTHALEFHDVDKVALVPYQLTGKKIECVVCNIEFGAISKLVIHMNTHYLNYVCDVCGCGFINTRSLTQHKKNTHRKSVCKICAQIFSSSSELQMHRIKVHKVVMKRHCMYCDNTFHSSVDLHMHKINDHGMERTEFKCPFCEKIFLIQYLLKSHIKTTHLKERKHACPKCEKLFYTKHELTRHLNTTHVEAKNFSCPLCNARFKSDSSLKRHLKKSMHRNVGKV